jgi:hypothetical protein
MGGNGTICHYILLKTKTWTPEANTNIFSTDISAHASPPNTMFAGYSTTTT